MGNTYTVANVRAMLFDWANARRERLNWGRAIAPLLRVANVVSGGGTRQFLACRLREELYCWAADNKLAYSDLRSLLEIAETYRNME